MTIHAPRTLLLTSLVSGFAQAQTEWSENFLQDHTAAFLAVSADVDGDGDLDVFSVGGPFGGNDNLRWNENIGGIGAKWGKHAITTLPTGVADLEPVDVDRDGDVDLAFVDATQLGWLENELGDGSTWSLQIIDAALLSAGTALVDADFDGDGDADFLVGGVAPSLNVVVLDPVHWYENGGDGTSWTIHTVPTFGYFEATDLAAADFDLEGSLDLLLSSVPELRTGWFENAAGDGSNWVETLIALEGCDVLAVGDLECDGDADVTHASIAADELGWSENLDGSGGAWASALIAGNVLDPTDLALFDADEDGDPDLGSSSEGDDRVLWFENATGNGLNWIEKDVTVGSRDPRSLRAVDLNLDGALDLVMSSSADSDLLWFENPLASATLDEWSATTVSTATDDPKTVFAADMDGDGDLDAVSGSDLDGSIRWHENLDGSGTSWTDVLISATPGSAESLFVTDLDGDGDPDVLVAFADLPSRLAWLENLDGDGSSWSESLISTSVLLFLGVSAGDIDGDGDQDALAAVCNPDEFRWFENVLGDGTSWSEAVVSATENSPRSITSADVDLDGNLDVVGASFFGDKVSWHENALGDGSSWIETIISSTTNSPEVVCVGDLDGDGDQDVVSTLSDPFSTDKIVWFDNHAGDGSSWLSRDVSSSVDTPRALAVGDVDGDGDVDALSSSVADDEILWHVNANGDASEWADAVLFDGGDLVRSIFVADINGDGELDLLAGCQTADTLTWHERDGSPAPYGCGVNPVRSLRVLAEPTPSSPLVVAVDNPLGTQAAGSIPFLFCSFAPDANFPCGTLLPRFGMEGPGEVLLGLAPGDLLLPPITGPPWTGHGCPTQVSIAVPTDGSLLGVPLHLQAFLLDSLAAFGVRVGLTNAVQIEPAF